MSSGAGLGCGPPVSELPALSLASGLRLNRLVRASRPRVSAAEHVVRLGPWVRPAGVQRQPPLRFGLAVKQARPLPGLASTQRSMSSGSGLGCGPPVSSAQPSRCASGLRLNRLVRASRPRVSAAEHVVRLGPWVRPAGVQPRSPSRCASGLRLNRLGRASRPRVSAAEHVVRCGLGCGPSHSCLTASPQGLALEGGV